MKLAPCDATVNFVAGLLEVTEYQKAVIPTEAEEPIQIKNRKLEIENASAPGYSFFTRAIELDGQFFSDCATVYLGIDRPDLAVLLATDDLGCLSRIARMLSESDSHSQLADAAHAEIRSQLEIWATTTDVTAPVLASLADMYAKEGDNTKAIDYYRRALDLDYSQYTWRLSLAKLLADAGKIDEAIHEARICLRLLPSYRSAKELIENLSVRSKE